MDKILDLLDDIYVGNISDLDPEFERRVLYCSGDNVYLFLSWLKELQLLGILELSHNLCAMNVGDSEYWGLIFSSEGSTFIVMCMGDLVRVEPHILSSSEEVSARPEMESICPLVVL